MAASCLICDRVAQAQKGENPLLIYTFENSYFVLGDHQFFKGYALILFKEHVRELHDLTTAQQQALFAEVMLAGNALSKAFGPWKMNYSCLGNTEEHVHWHLMPRYEDEIDRQRQPWLHSDKFKDFVPNAAEKTLIIDKIRAALAST